MNINIIGQDISNFLQEILFENIDDNLQYYINSSIEKILNFYVSKGDIYEFKVTSTGACVDVLLREHPYSSEIKNIHSTSNRDIRQVRKEKLEKLEKCQDQ